MKLLKSIFHLSIFQAASYFVPLIITPYLSRTLGLSQFGIMGVALALVGYVGLVSDWGFSLSATQAVAMNADNPITLRRIFWDTLFAKLALGVTSFVVFTFIVLVIPSLRSMWPLLLAASVQVFVGLFSVNWMLQGLELMGIFASASMAGRLLTIPLILLFVHSPLDTARVLWIQGATASVSTIISLIMVFRQVQLGRPRISWIGCRSQISGGFRLFLASGAISFYTQINLIVLNFVAGPVQAGLFNGADRIRKAVYGISSPISTAVYPRINNIVAVKGPRAFPIMLKYLSLQGGVTFILSSLMLISAPWVTVWFLGEGFRNAVPIVQWMSAIPFLVGLNNGLGNNMMLPLGMKTAYTVTVTGSGVVNMLLLFPLCARFGGVGAAISVVVTELFVVVSMASWIAYHVYRAGRTISVIRQTNDSFP